MVEDGLGQLSVQVRHAEGDAREQRELRHLLRVRVSVRVRVRVRVRVKVRVRVRVS